MSRSLLCCMQPVPRASQEIRNRHNAIGVEDRRTTLAVARWLPY